MPLIGPSELAARSETRVESNQLLESIIVQLQNFKEIQKNLINEVTTLAEVTLVLPVKDATSKRFFSMIRANFALLTITLLYFT